jgi:hypothetical protein
MDGAQIVMRYCQLMAKNSSVGHRNCPQYHLVSCAGIYLLNGFKLTVRDASRTFCNHINTQRTGKFSNLRVMHSMCYTNARCTINSFECKCARENLHSLHLTTSIPRLRVKRWGGGRGGGNIFLIFFKF